MSEAIIKTGLRLMTTFGVGARMISFLHINIRRTRLLKSFLSGALLLVCVNLIAQAQRVPNLKNFDNKPYHFGFILGYNSADFFMDLYNVFPTSDSLLSVSSERQPGFDLGPLASLNLTKNISLRFIPTISFQDRKLFYTFYKTQNNGQPGTEILTKRIESTFINAPFLLKLRTDRVNNFAAYALGGYQIGIDMASQKDVDNSGPNAIVKIKRFDQAWQVGGGLDFFLPYFKFGVEIKLSHGLPNLLIQDNTQFSSPVDALRSKCWYVALTFEG